MNFKKLEKKMAELEKLQTETENAHAKLKAQIAELKALHEELPEPPHPRWIPKESEFYYYIGDTGGIHIDRWNSDNIDDFRFSTGNVFPRANVFDTSAEAEFVVEHLKVLAEMREWAGSWNDQYTICVDPCDGTNLYVFDRLLWTSGEIRFATKEDAEGCIKAVGKERLLRYYFMVPEEDDDGID